MLRLITFTLIFFYSTLLSAIPVHEGYITSSDTPIYYKKIGHGNPIIFIHGGPGHNSSYFFPQFETLADNHELIFFDQRGTGNSSENFDLEKMNLHQFVSDIEELRKQLSLEKFTLVGYGWGALLAYEYLSSYQENVLKLILIEPFPASSQDMSSFVSELQHRLSSSNQNLAQLAESDLFLSGDLNTYHTFYKTLFTEFLHNPNSIDRLNFELKPEETLQGVLIFRIFEQTFLNGYDFKAKLKKIKVPTLIIHGDSDAIPLWTAKETASLLPSSELKIIKDCGHFPHVEQPGELFKNMEAFLSVPFFPPN